jgi:hypothetical protein
MVVVYTAMYTPPNNMLHWNFATLRFAKSSKLGR